MDSLGIGFPGPPGTGPLPAFVPLRQGHAGPSYWAPTNVEQYANNPQSTLASSIDAAAGSFLLSNPGLPPSQFSSAGPFRVLIDQEIVVVADRDGNSCAVMQRGAEGTQATLHAAGAAVVQILTATAVAALPPFGSAWWNVPPGSLVQVQDGACYSGDGTGAAIQWLLPGTAGHPVTQPRNGSLALFMLGASLSSSQPGAEAVFVAGPLDMVADPQQPGTYSALGGTVNQTFGQLIGLKYDLQTRRWITFV